MTDLPLYTDHDFAYAYLRKTAVEFAEEGEHYPYCWRVHGWCAVIKVLDDSEDELRKARCKHVRWYVCRCDKPDCGKRGVPGHDKAHDYCPKCGEKL